MDSSIKAQSLHRKRMGLYSYGLQKNLRVPGKGAELGEKKLRRQARQHYAGIVKNRRESRPSDRTVSSSFLIEGKEGAAN